MPTQPTVMISSTARDLPAYREQVELACQRLGMVPRMMEHLSAMNANAVEASLAMVDGCDVYVGLFAHRYGHVAQGMKTSITQLEYERAVQKGIPRLVFLIDEEVPVKPRDIDTGEKAEKLKALKQRLMEENVVAFFESALDLSTKVFQSLVEFREAHRKAQEAHTEKQEAAPAPVEETDVDPLAELPPLPELDLPPTPYRRLQWFRREDAGIFFGRGAETRELYKALSEQWCDPIVLFYGESGVGKSSLLAAGVRPRLELSHSVHYIRRDRSLGLAGSLAQTLETSIEKIADEWKVQERRQGKPLIVILDQVEELYTRPIEREGATEDDELQELLGVLQGLFAEPAHRPRGRLVLSFRKEWVADIEARLIESSLPFHKLFLERMGLQGVLEVVRGPASSERLRKKYNLSIEEDLPEIIAASLLKDRQSPVAPTLSILLAKMWEQVKNDPSPAFTKDLYLDLAQQGLLLSDFLDEQLEVLHTWNAEAVESGLALDVLNHHTTDLGTAETRLHPDLAARYPHRPDVLEALLLESQAAYLLVGSEVKDEGGTEIPATRLAHDTLAPLIRQRYKDSDRPGQRAERVLQSRVADWRNGREGAALDEAGLAEVEQGLPGMRSWNEAESRLVAASRQARQRRRMQQYALYGAGVLVIGILGWVYQYTNRHNVCNTAGTQYEWCRACIDNGGEWSAAGDDISIYCEAARFALPDITEDFVEIPAGTFMMGSEDRDESPVHEVRITAPFYLSKTEVTQAWWYVVMGNNPSYRKGADLPVEQVSWEDVEAFLDSLNVLAGCDGCYRLPTEAEWEYAARAGTSTAYSFGDDASDLGEYGWYAENSGGGTQPVGTRSPNPWGLYDMHGNVWEWVQDWYGVYPDSSVTDPTGPESGSARVFRGGGWGYYAGSARSAIRIRSSPGFRDNDVGFRVLRTYP